MTFWRSNRKLYIDAGVNAGVMAAYLELQGYHYGYSSSGRCERRSAHNMPYITVDGKDMLYNGTKGKACEITWYKLTDDDIATMRKELIESGDMQPETDQEIYDKFYSMFGKNGLSKAFDGFGRSYDRFDQIHGRQREVVVKRMKQAIRDEINLANHRKVMSKDERRVERVWVTANGREVPISRMDDEHLHNTILYIDRKMSEGVWRLGMNNDLSDLLKEMEDECIHRNLPLPLLPIKSLAYRRKENV